VTNPSCPYCGNEADADFMDNGVGMERVGPWGCDKCHAYELDPFLQDVSKATPEEKERGWWKGRSLESQQCRTNHTQNCHFCDDISCGDNTSQSPHTPKVKS
jgi:hypothetical protein